MQDGKVEELISYERHKENQRKLKLHPAKESVEHPKVKNEDDDDDINKQN